MRHGLPSTTHFFFTTTPLPCPYLAERVERRMVTELMGMDAARLNDKLSMAGFRRSHTIAYAPVCDGCSACVSVRVPAGDFKANRTQRRILNRNEDLLVEERAPIATREQYDLFSAYISTRHGDGDMAMMGHSDYRALVEETPVPSNLIEFRNPEGRMVAGCLTDRLGDGLSAVYSFFDPEDTRRSLGTYVVLWLIERAQELGLDHVYLGYWVQGSPKMDYKRNFRPLEAYTPDGWKRLADSPTRKLSSKPQSDNE